jgi:hypothetical protein
MRGYGTMLGGEIGFVLDKRLLQVIPRLKNAQLGMVVGGGGVEEAVAQSLKVVDVEGQVEIFSFGEQAVDVDRPAVFGEGGLMVN